MKNNNFTRLLFFTVVLFIAYNKVQGENRVTNNNATDSTVKIPDPANFNRTIDGKQVRLYILKNKNGATVAITNFGARLVSLVVPDKNNNPVDVILGHDSLADYRKRAENYYGAIIGRYGNRIAKGKFTLDGQNYKLDLNGGANTLHGGFSGFYNRVFDVVKAGPQKLQLTYFSKDGEGGYPGNLTVNIVYTLTNDNSVKIGYTATTDKNTVINLTNHAYFNLNGAGTKTITDNLLKINAANYLPVDASLIPTGNLAPVKGTPFDFTAFKVIGKDIDTPDGQLKIARGYDHNFVLNPHTMGQPVATVKSPQTGIVMDVYTSEPGLQFYTGNFVSARVKDGKGNKVYGYRSALCLETQHYPDSPNQPSFPSTVLKPGETYHTVTVYKFRVGKKGKG